MTPTAASYTITRLEASVIQAHQLRRVPILTSALCRVRQGEKLLQWGERVMRAGPQHLILLPAGEELGIANYPGARGYRADVVTLPAPLLAQFRSRHGALTETQTGGTASASLCVSLDATLSAVWEQLLHSLNSAMPPLMQNHYAEGVLLALSLAGQAGPMLMDRRDPLAARVQQLLVLDPARQWTVAAAAQHLSLGASTLRRQLALEGRGFREILEEVRLGMALQWLQTSRKPIGDIAHACGYSCPSRFAIRFRQHYGLSPSRLRAATYRR